MDAGRFPCLHPGCDFRSKYLTELATHVNSVHLQIRAYPCHICRKRFGHKWNLRRHMQMHVRNKEHGSGKCRRCNIILSAVPACPRSLAQAHSGAWATRNWVPGLKESDTESFAGRGSRDGDDEQAESGGVDGSDYESNDDAMDSTDEHDKPGYEQHEEGENMISDGKKSEDMSLSEIVTRIHMYMIRIFGSR